MHSLSDLRVCAHPHSTTLVIKSQHSGTPGALATAAGGRLDDAPGGGGGAVLGTNAKYSASPEKTDAETGEVTGGESLYSPMGSRLQRFMLQSVARKFLPKSRTDKCLRFARDLKKSRCGNPSSTRPPVMLGCRLVAPSGRALFVRQKLPKDAVLRSCPLWLLTKPPAAA